MGADVADHEPYPGLRNYVSVTIHDTDEGKGVQYPMIAAFLPLNYCPVDNYVTKLSHVICFVVWRNGEMNVSFHLGVQKICADMPGKHTFLYLLV